MDIAGLRKTFAERLKDLRDERGLNQGQFADSVGISRGAMSYYEQEARTPDIGVLKSICETCGVSADYMIGLMPDRNHIVADVCLETGLYPKAVKRLRMLQKMKNLKLGSMENTIENFPDDDPDEVVKMAVTNAAALMVNMLLSTDEGLEILMLLSAIIFGAELVVDGDGAAPITGGEKEKPQLRVMTNHKNIMIDILVENITSALWVDVQEAAAKLRDDIAAANEEPGRQ